MTYGYRPENWPAFQAALQQRGIAPADIEKVEIRPEALAGLVSVTVTLRSGRVESWSQHEMG